MEEDLNQQEPTAEEKAKFENDVLKAAEEAMKMEAEANKVQSDYQEEDPKVGIVSDYLDRLLPPDWMGMDLYQRRQWLDNIENIGTERRETVSLIEIWAEALGKSADRFDRYSGAELRNILANMPEWVRVKDKFISTGPYGRQRYYKRRDCT